MSYCRNRLSEPTARITSSPSAERLSAKPGMSYELHGSTSSRMPSLLQRGGRETRGYRRWSRAPCRHRRPRRRNADEGSSVAAPSAPSRIRSRVRRLAELVTRSGRHAMPRSPASQLPAGRLCSTSFRLLSARRLAQLGNRIRVRKQELDGFEARVRRGRKAVEERDFVETAWSGSLRISAWW